MTQSSIHYQVPYKKQEMEWYIGYTFPKAERKIHLRLEELGVSSFLPMQKIIRNWSDRKKKLEVPLFPNYIFIYTSNVERSNLLSIKELIKFVTFDGKPARVSSSIIVSLQKMLVDEVEVHTERFFSGMRVRVNEGPFIGIEGILIKRNGKTRFVIQIEALQRTVSVDIPIHCVVPIEDDYKYRSGNSTGKIAL